MNWLAARFKPILLVCGALTCTMICAALAPQAALRIIFGEAPEGPAAEVVVRSWGVLIALVGAMLIYAAFDPPSRPLVLTVAAVGKLVFIGLVLSHGRRFLGHPAGIAVVADALMVLLFAACLVAARRAPQSRS
jgi:hypothetical protein